MLVPTRVVAIPTTAGHKVSFRNGIAEINDTNDLPYLLARDDCKIMLTEYAMSWIGDVLKSTRQVNATVIWPAGWDESGRLAAPDPDDENDEGKNEEGEGDDKKDEAVVHGDMLDQVLKTKRRWQSKPAN